MKTQEFDINTQIMKYEIFHYMFFIMYIYTHMHMHAHTLILKLYYHEVLQNMSLPFSSNILSFFYYIIYHIL
jgi:hypothetical protein